MATTIITKHNDTAPPLLGDLVEGELAIWTGNGRLYTRDASNNLIEVSTNPSDGSFFTSGAALEDAIIAGAASSFIGQTVTSESVAALNFFQSPSIKDIQRSGNDPLEPLLYFGPDGKVELGPNAGTQTPGTAQLTIEANTGGTFSHIDLNDLGGSQAQMRFLSAGTYCGAIAGADIGGTEFNLYLKAQDKIQFTNSDNGSIAQWYQSGSVSFGDNISESVVSTYRTFTLDGDTGAEILLRGAGSATDRFRIQYNHTSKDVLMFNQAGGDVFISAPKVAGVVNGVGISQGNGYFEVVSALPGSLDTNCVYLVVPV